MKCPSCNSPLDPQATRCAECGHAVGERGFKSTIMGLPAQKRIKPPEDGSSKGGDEQRHTLFGAPAASGQEPDDDEAQDEVAATEVLTEAEIVAKFGADGPQLLEPDDDEPPEADRARQGHRPRGQHDTLFGTPSARRAQDAPPADRQDPDQSDATRNQRSTMFGLPRAQPDGGADADRTAERKLPAVPGLDRESSGGEEEEARTMVAPSNLVPTAADDQSGGYSRARVEQADPNFGTLQGMNREELAEARAEEELRTRALQGDQLDDLEQQMAQDRRRKLMDKLREKRQDRPPSSTEAGLPAAPRGAGSDDQPAVSGPRFSIPKPSQRSASDAAGAGKPAPKPALPQPKPDRDASNASSLGGLFGAEPAGPAHTNFSIPGGGADDIPMVDVEPDVDELETVALSADAVEPVGGGSSEIWEYESDVEETSGGSSEVWEFTEDDEDDSLDELGFGGPQAWLDEETGVVDEPLTAQDLFGDEDLGFDATADTPAPPAPAQRQPAAQPQHQQPQHGAAPRHAPPQRAEPAAPRNAPTSPHQPAAAPVSGDARLIGLVQGVFNAIGGLLVIGAGVLGFLSLQPGAARATTGVALAPAIVGLILLAIAFAPISGRARSMASAIVGLLALGLFAGAFAVSLSHAVLLFNLGGGLLALCAAGFPFILRFVK